MTDFQFIHNTLYPNIKPICPDRFSDVLKDDFVQKLITTVYTFVPEFHEFVQVIIKTYESEYLRPMPEFPPVVFEYQSSEQIYAIMVISLITNIENDQEITSVKDLVQCMNRQCLDLDLTKIIDRYEEEIEKKFDQMFHRKYSLPQIVL